jgi:hypothetical protein
MTDKQDDRKVPEMPVAEELARQGMSTTPQQSSGTGGGGHGIASGHNPGGMIPGGGPKPELGSLGAGNAETGGAATGSQKRGGR